MSRAIVNKDMIVKITVDPKLGIEIGSIPRGVGLERLRWDGSELIDLLYLDKFYVDRKTRKLHATKQPNCDKITMSYNDRFNLIEDPVSKKLRVMTDDEIKKPKKEEYIARRRKEYPSIGDQVALIMDYLKTKPGIGKELEQTINKIDEVKNRWPKTS